MIYLITGSPGTGKTAMAVSMILENYDGLFRMKAEDGLEINRPLYFCHIDGLDTKKLKAHELSEADIQAAPLKEVVPTGSVVIVDEADYTYPVRSASREVPPYIKTLKELRHEGFTLILMTQHPTMLDSYLRNLVGKHIHLERKQIGTKRYEFFRTETNLTAQGLAGGVSKWYKPNKKAFAYYKSASVHIKFSKARHWIFYALRLVVVFLAWFGKPVVDKMRGKTDVVEVSQDSGLPLSDGPVKAASVAEYTAEYYQPRVIDKPETAPIYDAVRQVADYPQVVACVATADSCNCYTQQATLVPEIDERSCRNRLESRPFNPYKEPSKDENQQLARRDERKHQDAPSVAVMGGKSPQNLMYDNHSQGNLN